MPLTVSKALTYVTPYPIWALKTAYNYKLGEGADKYEYNESIRILITTAITATTFFASARLQSVFGSRSKDAVILGSIFHPGVLGQRILAQALVASFHGIVNAVNGKNPTALAKNVAFLLLACAASSRPSALLYYKWIVQPIADYLE